MVVIFPHEVYSTKKQPLSALPSSATGMRRVLRKSSLLKNQHFNLKVVLLVVVLLVLLTQYSMMESWKLDYAGPASKAKFLSFAAFICRLMMIIIAGERWEFREALCVISPMSGI